MKRLSPELQKEYGYSSSMEIPRLVKISLNIGLGEASQNSKLIDAAAAELTAIAGQKAVVTLAKKSIAQFKLREGMPVGTRVTLRGDAMWDFYDKLVSFALPVSATFAEFPIAVSTVVATSPWASRNTPSSLSLTSIRLS